MASVRPPAATLSPSGPAHVDVAEQLGACMELLRWLDGQLQLPTSDDSKRERALARVVLQEATALIEQCRSQASVDARALQSADGKGAHHG